MSPLVLILARLAWVAAGTRPGSVGRWALAIAVPIWFWAAFAGSDASAPLQRVADATLWSVGTYALAFVFGTLLTRTGPDWSSVGALMLGAITSLALSWILLAAWAAVPLSSAPAGPLIFAAAVALIAGIGLAVLGAYRAIGTVREMVGGRP